MLLFTFVVVVVVVCVILLYGWGGGVRVEDNLKDYIDCSQCEHIGLNHSIMNSVKPLSISHTEVIFITPRRK